MFCIYTSVPYCFNSYYCFLLFHISFVSKYKGSYWNNILLWISTWQLRHVGYSFFWWNCQDLGCYNYGRCKFIAFYNQIMTKWSRLVAKFNALQMMCGRARRNLGNVHMIFDVIGVQADLEVANLKIANFYKHLQFLY